MSAADATPLVPPHVLAGLVDGEVGSKPEPPAEQRSPASAPPRTEGELRASIAARLAKLGRDDLLCVEWVLSRLPFAYLLELCERETRAAVLGADGQPVTPSKTLSPAQQAAHGAVRAAEQSLLSALRRIAPVVGLPQAPRPGTGKYLRPEER